MYALGALYVVLMMVMLVLQVAAFMAGIEVWFGWTVWGGIGSLALCLLLGTPGVLACGVVAYVGATAAWGLTWWQAVLMIFPGFVLAVTATGFAGAWELIERRVRRRE